MPKLGVNIDHVATIREARKGREPDPVAASLLAELAGAHGITVHLREDRRHIQDRDVKILRQTISTRLNLEMAPTKEMIQFAIDIQPDMVTLVPESREEITTEGGLDVARQVDMIEKTISSFKIHNIFVSLFIDTEIEQVKAAKKCGADCVEIHTGAYANAYEFEDQGSNWEIELDKVEKTSQVAQKNGLVVNAGHGLNYQNVKPIASILGMQELNIGHSIVSRSVLTGMDSAVRDMLKLMS